jgi:hypothetical protein
MIITIGGVPASCCHVTEYVPRSYTSAVGVLEDWPSSQFSPCYWVNKAQVRKLFVWDGVTWHSFSEDSKSVQDNPAKEEDWALIYQGARVGNITTRTTTVFEPGSRESGVQEIVSPVPEFFGRRKREIEYSRWDTYAERQPVVLVQRACRKGRVEDWDVFDASQVVTADVVDCLCRNVTDVYLETDVFSETNDSGREVTPLQLKANWVQANIHFAFRMKSSANIELIAVTFAEDSLACDLRGFDLGMLWFVKYSNTTCKYLDRNLRFLDLGDFNSDGKPEFLFQVIGYNEDGYRLYWNEFHKNISTSWWYH